MKLINKDQVTSVTISKEKLMKGYVFQPEKIYKLPFTNIVLSKTNSHWVYPNRYYSTYSGDELKDFIVRDSQLFRKPKVEISFTSGWRDDVVMFFNTYRKAMIWVDENLSDVPLIEVYD
jgi:hypothetical protein